MSAYIIVDITVHDPEKYKEYVSIHVHAFLQDPEYQSVAAIRHAATTSKMLVVEGHDST